LLPGGSGYFTCIQNVTLIYRMWHWCTECDIDIQNVTLMYRMWHWYTECDIDIQNVTLIYRMWHCDIDLMHFGLRNALQTLTYSATSLDVSTDKRHLFLFVFGAPDPQWARTSSFTRFLDHTHRRTTIGRTPLDEWSALRGDLYLTTHNTHNRRTSMSPVGFETTVSANERPQTYALDHATTGTGQQ
jgi:hypothetical protein